MNNEWIEIVINVLEKFGDKFEFMDGTPEDFINGFETCRKLFIDSFKSYKESLNENGEQE